MGPFSDIKVFIDQLNAAHDLHRVACIVDDMAQILGFEYFALRHHAKAPSHYLLHISNYPDSWKERFTLRTYLSDDPAVAACQNAIVGFLWSDIDRLITLNERQKAFLAESRNAGLGEGFTVPIHLPGECAGSCDFVTIPEKSISASMLPAAQYAGCLAFDTARRLARNGWKQSGSEPKQPVPRLSTRQLDCLVLAAQGKSDMDTGQLLGISNQTVHQHIETAKLRYGVATRTQLIVHALFDTQLAYEDVLRH
jgi:LuxR family quorum-sensing system transcriptional regulator CciR